MLYFILLHRYIMRQQGRTKMDQVPNSPEPPIHLAVVACGDRLEETLTMAKSAVLFSIKRLHVHVFAEDQLQASFMEAVSCADKLWGLQGPSSGVYPPTEHILQQSLLRCVFQLESWPDFIRSKFNYTVYPISFPSENAAEWKKLFKPCASQRLFLPVRGVYWTDILWRMLHKIKN